MADRQRALHELSSASIETVLTGAKRRRSPEDVAAGSSSARHRPSTAAFLQHPGDAESDDEWEDAIEVGGGRSGGLLDDDVAGDDDDEEDEDDEGEWEEAVNVHGFTTTTVDIPVDHELAAQGQQLGPAVGAVAPPPAAPQPVDPAELRLRKRKRNARRRALSEAMHRTALLCWLGHGRLLSAQADDPSLQGRLLSLLPGSVAQSLATVPHLANVAHWLHSHLQERGAGGASAGGGGGGRGRGRGGGGGGAASGGRVGARGRARGGGASIAAPPPASTASPCEPHPSSRRAWALVHLIERAAASEPPPMIAAAAPLAARRLTSAGWREPGLLPLPGAAPFYTPPKRDDARVAALAAELLQQDAGQGQGQGQGQGGGGGGQGVGGDGGGLGSTLEGAASTVAQRTLLLLAAYRALGLRARLVVALQPPPLKPPPEGKAHPTPAEPPPSAPHVPLWCEVFLVAAQRWVPVDPTRMDRPLVDAPEAIASARLGGPKGSGARSASLCTSSYIVGLSADGARDVTARYAVNLVAARAARTDESWWCAAMRTVASLQASAAAAAAHERANGVLEGCTVVEASTTSAPSPSGASTSAAPVGPGAASTPAAAASTRRGGEPSSSAAHASASAPGGTGGRSLPTPSASSHPRATAGVGWAEVIDVDEVDEMEVAEAEELWRRERAQPLPTSLAEYKRHPLFVLARDIKSTQAIHPPSTRPIGLCKGQQVYSRACLYDLRSAQAWFRRGYDVRPGK